MKKCILIIAAASFAAMSCTKEFAGTSVSGLETQDCQIVATAGESDGAGEETKLNSSGTGTTASLRFISQDVMSVFDSRYAENENKGWQFKNKATGTAAKATFEGKIAKGATPKMALIPYYADATFDGDSTITTVLNSSMRWINENSVSTDSTPVVGVFVKTADDKDSVAFKNVCGFIQLVLPNDGGTGTYSSSTRKLTRVSKVVVRANEQMTGPVEIKYNGGQPAVTRKGTDTEGREITLSLKSLSNLTDTVGVTPNKPWYVSGSYIIPVIPGKYTGFSITYSFADGRADTTITARGSLTIERAKKVNIGDPVSRQVLEWKVGNAITAPAGASYTSFPTAYLATVKFSGTSIYCLYCDVKTSGSTSYADINDRYVFKDKDTYFNTGYDSMSGIYSNASTIFGTDYVFEDRDYDVDCGGKTYTFKFCKYYSSIPSEMSSKDAGAIRMASSYVELPAIEGKKLVRVYVGSQYATGTSCPKVGVQTTSGAYVDGGSSSRTAPVAGDNTMSYRDMNLSGTAVNTSYRFSTVSVLNLKLLHLEYE